MKILIASLVCVLGLAILCTGMAIEQEPDMWFSRPTSRGRRDTNITATHALQSPVCKSMVPAHTKVPQTDASPYRVTVDVDLVAAGDVITVTMSGEGEQQFVGFFCEARQVQTEVPVGQFQHHRVLGVVVADCAPGRDNAIFFINRTPLSQMMVKWKAPETPVEVVFTCTMVKDVTVFWTDNKSRVVTVE